MVTIISHLDDKFLFGKFKGEALGDVLMYAPDYLTWVIENVDGNRFVLMDSAIDEIKEIFPKYPIDDVLESNRQKRLIDYYGISDSECDYVEDNDDGPTLKDVLINDGCLGSIHSNSCDLLFFLESRSKEIAKDVWQNPHDNHFLIKSVGVIVRSLNKVFWRLIGFFNIDDFNKKETRQFGGIIHPTNDFQINRAISNEELHICRNIASVKDLGWSTGRGRLPIYSEICFCKDSFSIDVVQLNLPHLEANSLYRKIKRDGVNYSIPESEWRQNSWPTEFSFEKGRIVLRVEENSLLFKDKYGHIKSVGKEAIAIMDLFTLYDEFTFYDDYDDDESTALRHYAITDLEHVYLSNIPVSKLYELEVD